MALLLGNGVRGCMMEMRECFSWVDGGREGNHCCIRLLLDIGPLLPCHLFPSLNS